MKISPQSYLRYNAVTLARSRKVPRDLVSFPGILAGRGHVLCPLPANSKIVLVLEYVSISLLEFLVRKSSSTCLFCFCCLGGKETSFDSVYQREIVWPNSDQTVSAQQKLEAMPVVPFLVPF